MGPVASVIGAVASVVGTVGSLYFQSKAAKKAEQQQELSTRRSRRQAIRQMQLTRAQALMSAQGAGSLYGSGAQGGIGSLSSQVGAEMGYASAYGAMSKDISRFQSMANIFSGIGSIGGTLYQMGGGFGGQMQPAAVPNYTTGFNQPAPNRPMTPAPITTSTLAPHRQNPNIPRGHVGSGTSYTGGFI